jgi:hypothetical protein
MTESPQNTDQISFQAAPEMRQAHQQALDDAIAHLKALPPSTDGIDRFRINLDMAEAHIGLGDNVSAWSLAREAFDVLVKAEAWQDAVEACELMYQAQQPASLVALAHGVWLGITYPIKPQTTVVMLNYVVDESPDHSDGAAVAAATAHYIAGLRASDEEVGDISFLTRNLLVKVAERHSKIGSQAELDGWMQRLGLNDPAAFLPKMGRVLDLIVLDKWWIDRGALRARLPVN